MVGFSCRPFSTASPFRKHGTKTHADADLFEVFLSLLGDVEPIGAVAENVVGLLLPESTQDTTPSLERIVAVAKDKYPQYVVTV